MYLQIRATVGAFAAAALLTACTGTLTTPFGTFNSQVAINPPSLPTANPGSSTPPPSPGATNPPTSAPTQPPQAPVPTSPPTNHPTAAPTGGNHPPTAPPTPRPTSPATGIPICLIPEGCGSPPPTNHPTAPPTNHPTAPPTNPPTARPTPPMINPSSPPAINGQTSGWIFHGSSATLTATQGQIPPPITLPAYHNVSATFKFNAPSSGSGTATLSDASNNGDITPALPTDTANSGYKFVMYFSLYNGGSQSVGFGSATPQVTLTDTAGFGGATVCGVDVYGAFIGPNPIWLYSGINAQVSGNTVTVQSGSVASALALPAGQSIVAVGCR